VGRTANAGSLTDPGVGSDQNGLAGGGRRIRTAGPPRRNESGFAAEREVPQRRKEPSRKCGTKGSNPGPPSGESGEIHERACGAEVQPHPVHRKPAMKLVPRPGFVSIDRSAPGDPGADETKRSDF
jgi:hypothetical protein